MRKRVIVGLLVMLLALASCVTTQMYAGHEATDLSWIRPEMARVDLEKKLGDPEGEEDWAKGKISFYHYNRGLLPAPQAHPARLPIQLPIEAFLQVFTLGAFNYEFVARYQCQRGELKVYYDADELVVYALESDEPIVDMPLVSCGVFFSRRRPPTLRQELFSKPNEIQ